MWWQYVLFPDLGEKPAIFFHHPKKNRDRDVDSGEFSRSGQPTQVPVAKGTIEAHGSGLPRSHHSPMETCSAGAQPFLPIAPSWQMSVHNTMEHGA